MEHTQSLAPIAIAKRFYQRKYIPLPDIFGDCLDIFRFYLALIIDVSQEFLDFLVGESDIPVQ